MNISDFDFILPEELIAQQPSPDRDCSRLMVVNRNGGEIERRLFFEAGDYLEPGDVLVINDTRVIPARLIGRKITGGRVEAFLLERLEKIEVRSQKSEVRSRMGIAHQPLISPIETSPFETSKEEVWECFIRASKGVRPGQIIEFSDMLKGEVLEDYGDGRFRLLFHSKRPFGEVLEEIGRVPLPPYIKRTGAIHESPLHDNERYQTVFAAKKGAVAAPTAGLHFTEALLKRIKDKGIEVVPITLHVGPGTFLPVRVERVHEHRMLPERYEISRDAAAKINIAKKEGRRVIAVGTTSVRAMEAAADDRGILKPGIDRTSIFIYPCYTFKVVDALITNFHLPKSTLLMLISAFAGRDLVFKAYREAIEERYRFYSYGDAMMIL